MARYSVSASRNQPRASSSDHASAGLPPGCAAYNLGGSLVIGLVQAAEPSASGPLTAAKADLSTFCAIPVPTDPVVLAQDGPAFQAAWAALEPLIQQAIASAAK